MKRPLTLRALKSGGVNNEREEVEVDSISQHSQKNNNGLAGKARQILLKKPVKSIMTAGNNQDSMKLGRYVRIRHRESTVCISFDGRRLPGRSPTRVHFKTQAKIIHFSSQDEVG